MIRAAVALIVSPSVRVCSLAVDRSKFEPQAAQPEREDIAQSLTRDRVVPLAANRGDRDQSGVEKNPEVPGRCRPGVRESGAEVPGGERTPSDEHLQDVAARRVRQRSEDSIDVLEVA
jgi:hypothetical protein